ncbi:neuronal acetylcholine receptor subunit alpha-6-like [Mizuhopecten yessoensis]|nr:neuronal acetylcholine receptor subunit alpha-6-like [Mizuhopecten yessoensis]
MTSASTFDDVQNLTTALFVTGSYNKEIRPTYNQFYPTYVTVVFNLAGITDVDQVEEKLTTTVFLTLFWTDEHLMWDPATYGGLSSILVPQSKVWRPDIALENGFTKMTELGDSFLLLNIKSDGTVYWVPYEIFETKCSMDITYFPFDKQKCDINVGVWTSEVDDVMVRVGVAAMTEDSYQENGEWDLTETSATTYISKSNNANVKFSLYMDRKPQYYIYNVVAPILLLSILSVFTFAIPVDSGEKLGFCMTVYLAFAVFLTIVSASLPVSSYMSLLGKYLIFLLVVGTLIIVITAVELRIHFRDSSREIPGWVQCLVRFSLVLQCRRRRRKVVDQATDTVTKTSTVDDKDEDIVTISWMSVSAAIDFYCFWIFLTTVMLGTLVLFLTGYQESHA